ncbi:MAG: Transposase [Arthrobacter sp.]|jgi:transposase|nr:Transposase [Arthrobacter sp.]
MEMTRPEILAVYAEGPEAVVTLVQGLCAHITALEARISDLEARVHDLEAQLHLDSHNSGKPPASDRFEQRSRRRHRTHSLREASGRPPGGQPGHPGHTLGAVPHPDQVVPHQPSQCAHCQALLPETAPIRGHTARQVFDLPPLRLVVTEHQAYTRECPACGQPTTAAFPPTVRAPVQYGPQLLALATYLRCEHLVPLERTHQVLGDLLGQPVSEATLLSAQAAVQGRLQGLAGRIRRGLTRGAVVQCDESGCYVAQQRYWLHVATTPHLTLYGVSPHRGQKAQAALGVLPHFRGIAVHDAYQAYSVYRGPHALCNVHHLRELTYLAEEEHQAWAHALKQLLLTMHREVAAARQTGQSALPARRCQRLVRRYRRLLDQGYAGQPAAPPRASPARRGRRKQSKVKNLLDRFRDRQEDVLRFLYDFRVPFDNNLAERDLRMLKVQQKIAGCFRTLRGAEEFCRLRSYLSTAKKQGVNALRALQLLFQGRPFVPALT